MALGSIDRAAGNDPAGPPILLDPYAARSCALKTYNAFHRLLPRPEPDGRATGQPGQAEFAARSFAAVLAGSVAVVDLRGLRSEPAAVQQQACTEALLGGAEVILGALLPRDLAGHRSGRADLLVRHPDGSGWVPGVVKLSKVLDPRRDESSSLVSTPAALSRPQRLPGFRYRWHYRWTNALQLAHLYRMLQAAGCAADSAVGLVLANDEAGELDQVAVWLDLDEPTLPAGPGSPDSTVQESSLERYDREFALRLGLARRAAASEESPDLLPVVCRECAWCPWRESCLARLDPDDVSLRISKSPLDAHEISVLRGTGITTVADLAGADLDLLLPRYLPLVGHRAGGEDRLRLAQHRSRLLVDGVELERTDPSPVRLPRAELEIDIDIETSAEDRVYLWGFWVSDTATGESAYHQWSRFEALDDTAELALATEALGWLRDRVEGREVLVYHYSDYEVVRLQRLAARSRDAVFSWATGFAAGHFVDLFAVVRRHFFGTAGLGLKVVASSGANFHWRDEDPGGLNSLQWFADATGAADPAVRGSARERILAYNEDDVRATVAVREWLRGPDAPFMSAQSSPETPIRQCGPTISS